MKLKNQNVEQYLVGRMTDVALTELWAYGKTVGITELETATWVLEEPKEIDEEALKGFTLKVELRDPEGNTGWLLISNEGTSIIRIVGSHHGIAHRAAAGMTQIAASHGLTVHDKYRDAHDAREALDEDVLKVGRLKVRRPQTAWQAVIFGCMAGTVSLIATLPLVPVLGLTSLSVIRTSNIITLLVTMSALVYTRKIRKLTS